MLARILPQRSRIWSGWCALLAVLLLGSGTWFFATPTQAATSLFFSPASGQVHPGNIWTTTLMVSAQEPINSADVVVTFPANLLEATSVDTGGTVLSIVLFKPAIDNSNGTIRFVQTSPSPYSGSGGKIGTIT